MNAAAIALGKTYLVKDHIREEFYWQAPGTGAIVVEAGTPVIVTEIDHVNDMIVIETEDGTQCTHTASTNLEEA